MCIYLSISNAFFNVHFYMTIFQKKEKNKHRHFKMIFIIEIHNPILT